VNWLLAYGNPENKMKKYLALILCLINAPAIFAQEKDSDVSAYQIEAGVAGIATTGNQVPFWMRSNLYGNRPIEGVSAALSGTIIKNYRNDDSKLFDWGGAVDARLNLGKRAEFLLIEGYLKARLSIFQVKVGRSKDREGLMDSTLSCGSFSLSGNALGIPKVELSIPQYWYVPLTNKLLSLKGDFSYGLMGEIPIQYGVNSGTYVKSYYHHASLYGRFGKPDWKLKLYGAVNHDVIWGSDKIIFGDQYRLNDLEAFYYAVTGKKYADAKDISKIGNHLGSLDIAAEYNFKSFKVNIYHQFFYDKGALGYLGNIMDGLTGVSFTNLNSENSKLHLTKILFELFYSKNQAGEYGAKETPSGPEYYYNHAVYSEGFSYLGEGLGNPLITPRDYGRSNLVSDPDNYFINNRVIALNVGVLGSISNWQILLRGTVSRNYGDYRTSGPDEQWFVGGRIKQPFLYGKFTPVNQLSTYLEASKNLKKGYRLGFVLAGDYGDLLYNSIGGMVKLSKTW
jgi:hypothetical protein